MCVRWLKRHRAFISKLCKRCSILVLSGQTKLLASPWQTEKASHLQHFINCAKSLWMCKHLSVEKIKCGWLWMPAMVYNIPLIDFWFYDKRTHLHPNKIEHCGSSQVQLSVSYIFHEKWCYEYSNSSIVFLNTSINPLHTPWIGEITNFLAKGKQFLFGNTGWHLLTRK